MKKTNQKSLAGIQTIISCVILLMTFIGYLLWDLETPYCSDDMMYCTIADEEHGFWAARGNTIETIPDAIQSCSWHYGNVNGRLANLIHILFVPAGHTFEAVFLSIMALCMVVLTIAVARGKDFKVGSTMLAVVLIWCVYPWHNMFESLVYQMNYVAPTFLVLGVIFFARSVDHVRPVMYIPIAICGLLIGWMHEGFTIVLCCYLFLNLFNPFYREKRVLLYVLLGSLTVGFFINFFGGTLVRANEDVSFENFSNYKYLLTRVATQLWPMYLAIACFIAGWFLTARNERRGFILTHDAELVTAFVGLAMAFFLVKFDRVLWPMYVFTILVTVGIVGRLLDRIPSRVMSVAGVAFVILYGAWLHELVKWETLTGNATRTALNQLEPREKGRVCFISADLIPPSSIPWYLMGIVNNTLHSTWHGYCYGVYYSKGKNSSIFVAPESYKNLPFDEWPQIPGDNPFRGSMDFMASPDSLPNSFSVVLGPRTESLSPIDEFLSMMRGMRQEDTVVISTTPMKISGRFVSPAGDTLFRYAPYDLPRTVARRPMLELNILPTGVEGCEDGGEAPAD